MDEFDLDDVPDTAPKRPLTTTVGISRKVNDGNYGAGEVFTFISGIALDTTPDEMDEMLQQSNLAFNKIRAFIKAKYLKTLNDLPGI